MDTNDSSSSRPELRVFLVEDSPAIRERLTTLLEDCVGVCLVGTADSVEGSIAAIKSSRPDALVLDLRIIGGSGLEVLKAVLPHFPGLRVAVLTNYPTDQHRLACVAAGAEHFLDKSLEFSRVPAILSEWHAAPFRTMRTMRTVHADPPLTC